MLKAKNIAAGARLVSVTGIIAAVFALAACSALPQPPQQSARYDFGIAPLAKAADGKSAQRKPLALADVQASNLPDGSTAMLYRLAYANGQELRPYQRARWSLPPAQLLQQRLRSHLGAQRAVLGAGDGQAPPRAQGVSPAVLRINLEEFSQVFDAADASAGLVRLRATLVDPRGAAGQLLGQQLFEARQPALTADAAGGAKALAEASDAAIAQLDAWLAGLGY